MKLGLPENKFAKKQLVWVRTPKCASSSMSELIREREYPIRKIGGGRVDLYVKEVGEKKFAQQHKFTVVRNPYTRVISSYNYGVQKSWLNNEVSFLDFLQMPWEHVNSVACPPSQADPHVNLLYLHSRPITDYLSFYFGDLTYIDSILHYENLENDLRLLLGKFDIQVSRLPFVNRGQVVCELERFINSETIPLIVEKFRDDFRNFNYSTDPSFAFQSASSPVLMDDGARIDNPLGIPPETGQSDS